MKKRKNIFKEFIISLISLIAGITSSFSAAIIVEGLEFTPGGVLFILSVIILTVGFFISQFVCLIIVTGMYSFIKKKIASQMLEDDKIPVKDPEKIEKLRETIKIK
ncbi:MAG: hypothetical protein ACEPO8_00375 [Rhodothermaceae bacterium]